MAARAECQVLQWRRRRAATPPTTSWRASECRRCTQGAARRPPQTHRLCVVRPRRLKSLEGNLETLTAINSALQSENATLRGRVEEAAAPSSATEAEVAELTEEFGRRLGAADRQIALLQVGYCVAFCCLACVCLFHCCPCPRRPDDCFKSPEAAGSGAGGGLIRASGSLPPTCAQSQAAASAS